jgi:hypothetical protein
MSELHTDSVESVDDFTEATETGTGETGAELAPATGDNQEEKTSQDFNQESVNKAINKKHFQMKEAERRAEAAQKEAEELKARLQKLEQGPEPTIPSIPDPYSETYEQDMVAYSEAVAKKAEFDANQRFANEQKARQQQEAQEQQQKALQEKVTQYRTNAQSLGLDPDDVDRAGDAVVNYGISADVASFLLEDKDGPLITKYLADNPMEIERLSTMSPMMAAIAVNNDLRERASVYRPKTTSAPAPPETLSGGGVPSDDPRLKGVIFE